MSAALVLPPLPVLSVLLPGFGSGSVPVAVALLSKAPEALIVTVVTTTAMSDVPALPPLPLLSVLLPGFGSGSVPFAVATLSNAPEALIVAVTLMAVFAPEARLAMMHGANDVQAPLTLVIVRFVGVSVTVMFVAVDGPPFATVSV